MSLTPWRVIGVVAAAAVFLAIAVLDSGSSPSCSDANKSLAGGLVKQAEKGYLAILASEPKQSCAAKGMEEVGERLCARAGALLNGHATEAAVKLYTAALEQEPWHSPPLACAASGLDAAKKAGAAEANEAANSGKPAAGAANGHAG
jgi:hypothetical protein